MTNILGQQGLISDTRRYTSATHLHCWSPIGIFALPGSRSWITRFVVPQKNAWLYNRLNRAVIQPCASRFSFSTFPPTYIIHPIDVCFGRVPSAIVKNSRQASDWPKSRKKAKKQKSSCDANADSDPNTQSKTPFVAYHLVSSESCAGHSPEDGASIT